jgi:hypothetical protein
VDLKVIPLGITLEDVKRVKLIVKKGRKPSSNPLADLMPHTYAVLMKGKDAKPTQILKAVGERPAPGHINAKISQSDKDELVKLLGGEVGISRWIQSMVAAYIEHERRKDGECARFLSVLLPVTSPREPESIPRKPGSRAVKHSTDWDRVFPSGENGSGGQR